MMKVFLFFTSASSWCSISSLGARPWRLHSLDFTMIGSCPNDCLIIPLGTPLTDQLTSAWPQNTQREHKEGLGSATPNNTSMLRYLGSLCKASACRTTSFPLYVHLLPLHSAGYTRRSLQIPPLATVGLWIAASTNDRLILSPLYRNSKGGMA